MQKRFLLIYSLIALSALVYFVNGFLPETGFDALWYHLPIASIYSQSGIVPIPGNLLYYSNMPRLMEVIFAIVLSFFGEFGVHFLSFAVGISTFIILKHFALLFVPKFEAIVIAAIFYITPLVGWQSASAYVDIYRTFFETVGLYLIFRKKCVFAGILFGLAVSVKTLALGSVVISIFLIYFLTRNVKEVIKFISAVGCTAIPWFVSSFLQTGNGIYPIGSELLDRSHDFTFHPMTFFTDFLNVFIFPHDPISPIFIIILPLLFGVVFSNYRRFNLYTKAILIYSLGVCIVWWLTPKTGGGRFLLPYIPVLSLVVGITFMWLKKWKRVLILILIILTCFTNLIYRIAAVHNKGYRYLTGQINKREYLCSNLDFNMGNFVDCEGKVKYLLGSNLVLLSGVHNLYYVDFPYIHQTWYRKEPIQYILVQGETNSYISSILQSEAYREIYSYHPTNVKLYSKK